MQVIDREFLDQLSVRAQASPRRRMNHNFHPTLDDPCQRLLNAIEPGSYIRPHRHLQPGKPELFIVVRGRLVLVQFDADGQVLKTVLMKAGGSSCAAEVACQEWHTIISLEPGTVFLEVKPGPYRPIDEADLAPWAPAEGSPAVEAYLAGLCPTGASGAGDEKR